LYFERKNYKEAEKYYLIAIDEGYNPALNNLGIVYDELQNYELAEKY
jgi:TPR repeat protein